MIKSIYILPAFIIVALIQLFVPVKMIYDQESLLSDGQAFKFKTAPVDPNDYFRGKYIQLWFANTTFSVPSEDGWSRGDKPYVEISEDSEGFAQIIGVHRNTPRHTQDYFSAEISSVNDFGPDQLEGQVNLTFSFGFDRLYMEESKAQEAEDIYREAIQSNSNDVAYALVNVKNGSTALKDVLLNEVSLQELVELAREKK